MFRGRIILVFLALFLVASLFGYFVIDFREKSDIAYSHFESGRYAKVIELYKDTKPESDSEILVLSFSVSGLEREINTKKGIGATKDLNLTIETWKSQPFDYFHIIDPFLPLLKKHDLPYKRALTFKVSQIKRPIPKDKAIDFLRLLLQEDPRGTERNFGEALSNLLSKDLSPLQPRELGILEEDLNYLVSFENNPFTDGLFHVEGSQINLRLGPGKENPDLGKANSGDLAYCFEKDYREEVIAGKSSHWKKCFFPHLTKSLWIFGGFLNQLPIDDTKITQLGKRFKEIDNEVKIDFAGWSGEKPPMTFHGKYLPLKPKVFASEPGFPLNQSKTDKYERICKKLSGEKNYFEFSYLPHDSVGLVPLFEIELVYAGKSHLAYTVSTSRDMVFINNKAYALNHADLKRENFSLHIEGREKSKLLGSLWRRNTGLLQSLGSLPLDETVLESGKYSWEVCLPIALQPRNSEALLFEIRTGVH